MVLFGDSFDAGCGGQRFNCENDVENEWAGIITTVRCLAKYFSGNKTLSFVETTNHSIENVDLHDHFSNNWK